MDTCRRNANSRLICFANTAVLCLPSKEVQQRSQWLTNQAKADPKYAIPDDFARDTLYPR
jgi:hypothetical protein